MVIKLGNISTIIVQAEISWQKGNYGLCPHERTRKLKYFVKTLMAGLETNTKRVGRKPVRVGNNNIKYKIMATAIIQHEVKDFSEWKKIFDADEASRASAGVKLMGLYTSVKDPNHVTMIFEAPNPELYDIMMSDPKRQEDMKKAGVISAPVVAMLNKVGS